MKKRSEGPKSPLEWNQRVTCRTQAGMTITGKVTFIGYIPFPGLWSFVEVTTDDGSVYKTHGSQHPGARLTQLEAAEEAPPVVDHTEAGAQFMVPGTEGRREIPDSKLKPKCRQKDSPRALEAAEIDSKQRSLF